MNTSKMKTLAQMNDTFCIHESYDLQLSSNTKLRSSFVVLFLFLLIFFVFVFVFGLAFLFCVACVYVFVVSVFAVTRSHLDEFSFAVRLYISALMKTPNKQISVGLLFPNLSSVP